MPATISSDGAYDADDVTVRLVRRPDGSALLLAVRTRRGGA